MKNKTENLCSTCKHKTVISKTDNVSTDICLVTGMDANIKKDIVGCSYYEKKSKTSPLKWVAFILAYWLSVSVIMALLDNHFELKHTTIWNLGVVMGIASCVLSDYLIKD